MDYESIISELRSRQALINEAILVFERMALRTAMNRRERPPAYMLKASTDEGRSQRSRGKRQFSAEARQRMAEGQRRRWAEWRDKNR